MAVLDGVAAGEEVVTSAQFLIDSESKLREATAKTMEALKSTETDPEKGSMSMDDHQGMEQDEENRKDHSKMQMEGHTGMEMSKQMDESTHGAHDND